MRLDKKALHKYMQSLVSIVESENSRAIPILTEDMEYRFVCPKAERARAMMKIITNIKSVYNIPEEIRQYEELLRFIIPTDGFRFVNVEVRYGGKNASERLSIINKAVGEKTDTSPIIITDKKIVYEISANSANMFMEIINSLRAKDIRVYKSTRLI